MVITRPPELRITYTASEPQDDYEPPFSRRIHILGNNRFRVKTHTNLRDTIDDGLPYEQDSGFRFTGGNNLHSRS